MQPPPPSSGKPFEESLANLREQEGNLTELLGIVLELLASCRLRKQLGPADLSQMPAAPTLIQQTLWIPWIGGSSAYMLADLFRKDGSGNFTQGSGGGG